MKITKIKAYTGSMINRMMALGIAPKNGPKNGMMLVMLIMTVISMAYGICVMVIKRKVAIPTKAVEVSVPMM